MTIPINPAVRDFLAGRIWLRLHTPFPTETIDAHIASEHIQTIQGIQSTEDIHPSNPAISATDVKTTPNRASQHSTAQNAKALAPIAGIASKWGVSQPVRNSSSGTANTDLSDRPYTRLARHTDTTPTASIRRTDSKQRQTHPASHSRSMRIRKNRNPVPTNPQTAAGRQTGLHRRATRRRHP